MNGWWCGFGHVHRCLLVVVHIGGGEGKKGKGPSARGWATVRKTMLSR